jgi:3-oxoacyl-[acyl-carrier-protein] synthase II
MRRVAVTGIGLVTSLGNNVEKSWNNIIKGKSGIKRIPESLFNTDDLTAKIAGYIPTAEEDQECGLNVSDHMPARSISTMDRFIQLAMIAADEAIADSGNHEMSDEDKLRTGVVVGSGIGGLITIEANAKILNESGPRRISPFFIPATLINLASGQISIKYGFKGSNFGVVSACATGAHSIGEAARMIATGESDVMVCGGAESAICRLGIAGFAAARALSTKYNDSPESASRPWDKNRDGFVMGEGAGVLVLEDLERAKKRGAKIYGEVIGYGSTSDAHHITAPESTGDGAYRAMQSAIKQAGITPAEIDYVNAHGTSTPLGDMIEYGAVTRTFEGYDIKNLAMSSTKSAIGHLLGAAGSVEAIFCLLAMRDNIIPPTLNLDNPEEQCKINLVPHKAQEKKITTAMSNSFGFGGTNVSLILKAWGN